MNNVQSRINNGSREATSINIKSFITEFRDDIIFAKKDLIIKSAIQIFLHNSSVYASDTIIFNSQEFKCKHSIIKADIIHFTDTYDENFNAKSIYIADSEIRANTSLRFGTEYLICRNSVIQAEEIKFFEHSNADIVKCKFIGEVYSLNFVKDEL